MAIDRRFLKRLAELADGDEWAKADLLAEQFGPEYGESGETINTGLYDELAVYETELAREYGVELKASTMRAYRATALAWPTGTRVPVASFRAHYALRGKDHEELMRIYLRKMKREGKKALTQRMVHRYRSEDAGPKPGVPWESTVARAVNSLARRLVLGNIKTDRADWWNAKGATATRRNIVIGALRSVADKIEGTE